MSTKAVIKAAPIARRRAKLLDEAHTHNALVPVQSSLLASTDEALSQPPKKLILAPEC